MKIGPQDSNLRTTSSAAPAAPAEAPAGAGPTTATQVAPRTEDASAAVQALRSSLQASGGSASVKISAAASGLVRNTGASFDQVKVDRVSAALRSGGFVIDPDAIADRLIASASELLPRRTH